MLVGDLSSHYNLNMKTLHRWFRKFVYYMGKNIPATKPFWPFVLGTVGIGFSWTYMPHAFHRAFIDVPIVRDILKNLPYSTYLPDILAYAGPTAVSFASLMLICKGLQILDPEEFDIYNAD